MVWWRSFILWPKEVSWIEFILLTVDISDKSFKSSEASISFKKIGILTVQQFSKCYSFIAFSLYCFMNRCEAIDCNPWIPGCLQQKNLAIICLHNEANMIERRVSEESLHFRHHPSTFEQNQIKVIQLLFNYMNICSFNFELKRVKRSKWEATLVCLIFLIVYSL